MVLDMAKNAGILACFGLLIDVRVRNTMKDVS